MGDLALLIVLLIAAVCLALHNRHLADEEPVVLSAGLCSPETRQQHNR
ncbi:MAG TPA: hypothetical protein PKJ21_05985 [Anaerolineae bacterium]|nr:hypothetical protein [Anaerolineae bacterium]HNT05708.1 hypothetical protein [Anaerolineae bacterium]HOU23755.1 hypothetical protein [Anaerolineae bacterium]HQJ52436.1 hypothetical protein [Anaerolineae bacterium]